MKIRLLSIALLCCLPGALLAQAPKKDEKKAPAPKSASEQAFDEFQKVRNRQGAKQDQGRFQEIVNAGMKFLVAHPTSTRANEVVNLIGLSYPMGIDSKQPALRGQYLALLRLEIANQKYKDGVTDQVAAAMAAVDAAAADADVRIAPNPANLAAMREKIDALASTPAGNRFLTDRERGYAHLLLLTNQVARAEDGLKKLTTHADKGVQDMAKQELNVIAAKKTPIDLKFSSVDGKPVDMAQLRGKAVGLYFWSSTNKGSVDTLAKLRQFASDYKKRGFELVTVSFDREEDREKLMKYLKENKLAAPVYFDGKQGKAEFAQKLNVNSVPRLLLFDQAGLLQTSMMGTGLSSNYASTLGLFEQEVKRLLKIK